MKSYYLFLFCVLFLLFSCKEKVNTFYSIDYRKTFQYDSDWEVSDDIENINFISIMNTKDTNDDFQSNINFIIRPKKDTYLGDDYLYLKEQLTEALERKGYSIIEEKDIVINKQRALCIIASKTFEGKRYKVEQIYQLYDGVLIEATFISEAISFKEFQESAELILQSFKYYTKPLELESQDTMGREYDHYKNFTAYGPLKNNKREGFWSFYSQLGVQIETGHYKNGLKTGDWGKIYVNEDVSPREKKTYINDSLDGNYISYFYNGKIDSTGIFSKNRQIGIWTSYHSDGAVSKKGNYINGKKDGVWKQYYTTEQIQANKKYINGKKEGLWEYFYANGQLEKIEKYTEGIEDNTWVAYHPDGSIKHKNYYDNGIKIGVWETYYDTGKLEKQRFYNNGKQDGIYRHFNPQGNVIYLVTYKDGLKHGEYKYFSPKTGKPIREEFFKEDKKHGIQKEYYTNGQLKLQENFSYGKKQGKFFTYYENGQIKEEKLYNNDVLDGISKSYFKNGQLEKLDKRKSNRIIETTEYYANGQLKNHESYTLKKIKDYFRTVSNRDLESYYENGMKKVVTQKIDSTDYNKITYYPNGNIESKSFYKKGFISGKKYEYYYKTEGQIREITTYNDGIENGPHTEYYSNGKISEEGMYIDGKLDGIRKIYHNNGTLATEEFRASYELQNKLTHYYENGQIEMFTHFKDGARHGKEIMYYPNGQEMLSRIYENDLLMEVGKNFDKNGNQLPSGTLKKGNGTINFYDENGTLINQRTVIDGLIPSY